MRDGADLVVDGYDFAPTFSIWTTIEECLNPPLVWERDRGFFTLPPFSEPETFVFPEGIGPVECVNVEHEEVLLIPRCVDCRRVTFKYGLGDEFIDVLACSHKTGLSSTTPVRVRGVEVSPRDVVAAVLPDPATLGDRMHGRTCAGTWVTGTGIDGAPREVYLYHVSDNAETMARHGCAGGRVADRDQPGGRARAARGGRVAGRGRARPRGVRRGAVPRPPRATAARRGTSTSGGGSMTVRDPVRAGENADRDGMTALDTPPVETCAGQQTPDRLLPALPDPRDEARHLLRRPRRVQRVPPLRAP